MKLFFTAALALALVSAASNVIDLTGDKFQSIIEQDLVMVEFFAPWCGHCKALAPEYEKAADELKDSGISIAKVDCTVEQELCSAQGVQGYPTLKIFKKGEASEYGKGRNAEAIVNYLKKALLPSLSEVTAESFDEFSAKDKVVVIGYFENSASPEYAAYESVANKLRDDFLFGFSFSKDLAKKEGVEVPGVVLHKQFDEKRNVFPENVGAALTEQDASAGSVLTKELLTKFVQVNAVPLVNDIGPDNYSKYIEAGLPIAFTFVANDEQRAQVASIVEANAKKHRGKINFVYTDANLYGGHAANLNLKQEWPAIGIQLGESNAKFPFDQSLELNQENADKFFDDFVSGALKASMKSAPIPESNDEPVKIVVGDNFKDIVLNTEKDVLVEFYAPWCGHCKRLAPIWDELAEKVKGSSHIVIAKMDATENDLPSDLPFTIEGFPTLKLFKAKTNEIVDYMGDRTLVAFLDFLKENTEGELIVSESTASEDAEPSSDEHDEL